MVKKRSDGYGILISERPVRAEGSVFSAKVILFHDLSKRYAAFFCRCAGARATESAILCYPVLTDAFARPGSSCQNAQTVCVGKWGHRDALHHPPFRRQSLARDDYFRCVCNTY